MKLWIGSEYEEDIGDQLREARNFVEEDINKTIEDKTYEIELDDWDCIAIIMNDDPFHDEVIKYSKKKRDMDFRLKINFDEFRSADSLGRQKLIYQMLLRSLNLLLEKGANEAGVNALVQDVSVVANKNGWMKQGKQDTHSYS
ncbi:MAG: Imm44 family immunity protein [Pseudomonadales bacterium]|nr:Imm44 family immunity protein [Pseudomonadales bacterium]